MTKVSSGDMVLSPTASKTSHRFSLTELRLRLSEIDEVYFASSRGNLSSATEAAASLTDDSKCSALMLFYRVVFEFLEAHGHSETSSPSPNSREHAGPDSSRCAFLLPGTEVSNLVSRTPSMMSLGGTSLVSLHRPHVQTTTTSQKTVDIESGNKKINEYVLLGELGRGAQGKVKLAFDTDRNQLRAIKIIRRPAKVDGHGIGKTVASEQRKRIEQEIAITKRLRHKNLVSLYEVIDDPEMEKLYLVMQHVGDGPVTKFRGGVFCDRFEDGRCASFARQLSAGLMYLHQHGVVHRDIKPENILRGEGDEVLLADFGVSEMLEGEIPSDEDEASESWTKRRRDLRDRSVTVGGSRGTPGFLAPELIAPAAEGDIGEPCNLHHSGAMVDIWALGVTFFALLCGRLPWVVEDPSASDGDPERFRFHLRPFFNAVNAEPPMFPPLACLVRRKEFLKQHFNFEELESPIPRHWVDLIESMLRKDPTQRPNIYTVRRRVKLFRTSGVSPIVGFRRGSTDHSVDIAGDLPRVVREVPTAIHKSVEGVSRDAMKDISTGTLNTTLSTEANCAVHPIAPTPPEEGSPSPSFSVRRRRTRQWSED